MRASTTEAIATAGQSQVQAKFQLLNWGVSDNPFHDLGTDLWLMVRDARGSELGLLVGAQVKTSKTSGTNTKYFKEPVLDPATKEVTGWTFRDTREHFEYWLKYSVPHIVVLHDLEKNTSYWAPITEDSVTWTKNEGKAVVPRSQTLDEEHRQELLEVATSQRSGSTWEGSAWTGAGHIAPADHLRYALITPRLIAPHPNVKPSDSTPAQALATLVLCRFNELDTPQLPPEPGVASNKKRYPSVDDASQSPDFSWQLFAALYDYLDSGNVDALLSVSADATKGLTKTLGRGRKPPKSRRGQGSSARPDQHAAGVVMTAAAMLESGKAEEALTVLNAALDLDKAAPADHAWLQLQKARALKEVGNVKEARNLALEVQGLRGTAAGDPSAAAIAAAAARLVFETTRWQAQDIATVITESDIPAEWWRSQVIAQGLGKNFDQGFERWARRGTGITTVTFGTDNSAWRHIRAASLLSGFAGNHNGWRHSFSILSKIELEATDSQSEIDSVVEALTHLRMSGDASSLETAVRRLVRIGPAGAVKQVGEAVDLDRSTLTTSKSDIIFVTEAADVLTDKSADRHAQWAIRTLFDSKQFVKRVQPTYHVEIFVLKMLRALVPSVSPEVKHQIIDYLLSLPPQPVPVIASEYALLVAAFDSDEWSIDDRQRIADRTGHDDQVLKDAFTALLAEQNAETRTRLLEEARSGSMNALLGLRNVRYLPSDVVTAQVSVFSAAIREQLAAARKSEYDLGSYDFGETLTLLNMWHPEIADWEPIYDLLREPLSNSDHIGGTLKLIAGMPYKVPSAVADSLAPILRDLHTRVPNLAVEFTPIGGLATEALEAISPGSAKNADLWRLLAGDAEEQQSVSRIVVSRRDPTQLNLLVGLCHGTLPEVRGTVAFGIARWVSEGVAVPEATEILMQLLDDPGTFLARKVAFALHRPSDSTYVEEPLLKLQGHLSATVRRLASKAIESMPGAAESAEN